MLLPGCAEAPLEVSSEELYVRDFINRYGVPDTEHSWSMATSVQASVDVQGVREGTLEVFTAYPGSQDARLVARLPINNGSVKGNLPLLAGTEAVYLRVKDMDKTILSVNRTEVENNTLSVKLKVAAAPGNDKLPTIEEYALSSYIVPDMTRNYYYMYRDELDTEEEKDNFTYAQACAKFHDEGNYYFPVPGNEHYKVDYLDQNAKLTPIPGLKYLNGLYYEMGPALSYQNVLAPMFNTYTYTDPETGETTEHDGVFKEGQDNLDLYYHKGTGGAKFDPNVTFSVREEGPVTMQCIWRGTQRNDYFGYYYYKEGEEPTSEDLWNIVPKFIFLTPEDITETSSLTQQQSADGESEWQDMGGMGFAACSDWNVEGGDQNIRGRKYYLAYYGENYDEAPSYTFPTGIRIGYFLYSEAKQCIFFSDCKTAYELCRRTYGEEEGPLVRPFAAKFRMQNRTYVGFGDESGDCDLNDVVFIAENVYPDPTDITPPELKEEDPKEPDEPSVDPLAQTWTLACEDLGSTDDVDFNDVVLDVAYVAGETTLTIIPRAAGGTLVSEIYFREGDNDDFTRLGEIHNLMSSYYSEIPSIGYAMLNTEKSAHQVDPKTVKPIKVTVPADFDFAKDFLSRIKITTRQSDEKEYEAKEITAFTDLGVGGSIPQMLLLEGDWQWPLERVSVDMAYPEFKNWVKDHNALDWTKSRVGEYTVSHRDKCSH